MIRREPVYVVSGLPRAGTSLLMQIVVAAGFEPLDDQIRQADESNPKGYFELERVKQLASDTSWLFEAGGKVVKIVIPLLPHIPEELECKLLVIWRDFQEVVASQNQMLIRLGQQPNASPDILSRVFAAQYDSVISNMQRRKNVDLIEVRHRKLIGDNGDHAEEIARILEFLGKPREKTNLVSQCVDRGLYRVKR